MLINRMIKTVSMMTLISVFTIAMSDVNAQPMDYTIIDGPGAGYVLPVVGGTVHSGTTVGNIASGEGGCPDATIILGGIDYTTDAHYHGTLNGVTDPDGDGCGWGRTVPGNLSSFFISSSSSDSFDTIFGRQGLQFDTWRPDLPGPVILYDGILETGVYPPVNQFDILVNAPFGYTFDPKAGVARKEFLGVRKMIFPDGKKVVDYGKGKGWKDFDFMDPVNNDRMNAIWDGNENPGVNPQTQDGTVDGDDFTVWRGSNIETPSTTGERPTRGTNQTPENRLGLSDEVHDKYKDMLKGLGVGQNGLNAWDGLKSEQSTNTYPQGQFGISVRWTDQRNMTSCQYNIQTTQFVGSLFKDGFESGNTMRWSDSIP